MKIRATASEIPRHRFPVEPWRLVETEPDPHDLGLTESFFANGNGYLGMRANPAEGRHAHAHGTYVNGFHETWEIKHAENAFAFAKTGQTIVNVPDAKLLKIYVDDEPLLLDNADLDHYERAIDFRTGVSHRELDLADPRRQTGTDPVRAGREPRTPTSRRDAHGDHAARPSRHRSSSRRSSSTDRTARTSTTSGAPRSARARIPARRASSTAGCCSRRSQSTSTGTIRRAAR